MRNGKNWGTTLPFSKYFFSKFVILVTILLLFVPISYIFSAQSLDSETIILTTSVPVESTFNITYNGSPVEGTTINFTLGEPLVLRYHLQSTSTNTIQLKVTSANASGVNFRLKFTGATYYIPYDLYVDYQGNNTKGNKANSGAFANFTASSYEDLSGNITIETTDGGYTAGSYQDTITFEISGM
jgi:spore coat protein U-like protein